MKSSPEVVSISWKDDVYGLIIFLKSRSFFAILKNGALGVDHFPEWILLFMMFQAIWFFKGLEDRES